MAREWRCNLQLKRGSTIDDVVALGFAYVYNIDINEVLRAAGIDEATSRGHAAGFVRTCSAANKNSSKNP
jgi:hypothetical protein